MIVKHTKPFVTYVGPHYFYPGNNEFDAETSAQLQADPDFKSKIDSGLFQIITPSAVSAKPGALKLPGASVVRLSVANLPIQSAVKVIQGTFNKAELLRVQGVDMRKGIQDAITAQIKRIDDMAAPAEGKE